MNGAPVVCRKTRWTVKQTRNRWQGKKRAGDRVLRVVLAKTRRTPSPAECGFRLAARQWNCFSPTTTGSVTDALAFTEMYRPIILIPRKGIGSSVRLLDRSFVRIVQIVWSSVDSGHSQFLFFTKRVRNGNRLLSVPSSSVAYTDKLIYQKWTSVFLDNLI